MRNYVILKFIRILYLKYLYYPTFAFFSQSEVHFKKLYWWNDLSVMYLLFQNGVKYCPSMYKEVYYKGNYFKHCFTLTSFINVQ